MLSSDDALALLREGEQRLGVADHIASCIKRIRARLTASPHSLAGMIRFWLMMIAAGYEAGLDRRKSFHTRA